MIPGLESAPEYDRNMILTTLRSDYGSGSFQVDPLESAPVMESAHFEALILLLKLYSTWKTHFSSFHTPLEAWFWFQWTLTIPYDQGWWENWFKLYLRWFHCKNLDLYFSSDFKRVLWKYKIIRQKIAFYYIFGFFGTLYDGWSHFCGIKIQFLT